MDAVYRDAHHLGPDPQINLGGPSCVRIEQLGSPILSDPSPRGIFSRMVFAGISMHRRVEGLEAPGVDIINFFVSWVTADEPRWRVSPDMGNGIATHSATGSIPS